MSLRVARNSGPKLKGSWGGKEAKREEVLTRAHKGGFAGGGIMKVNMEGDKGKMRERLHLRGTLKKERKRVAEVL